MTSEPSYSLPDGKTLYWWTDSFGKSWACMGYDHGPLCQRCQPVDDVLGGLLENTIDGLMEPRQDPHTAEFQFKMTAEGNRQAAKLIRELAEDS